MLEVLQFVLGGFWVFVGAVILIAVTGTAVAEIIQAIRAKGPK